MHRGVGLGGDLMTPLFDETQTTLYVLHYITFLEGKRSKRARADAATQTLKRKKM